MYSCVRFGIYAWCRGAPTDCQRRTRGGSRHRSKRPRIALEECSSTLPRPGTDRSAARLRGPMRGRRRTLTPSRTGAITSLGTLVNMGGLLAHQAKPARQFARSSSNDAGAQRTGLARIASLEAHLERVTAAGAGATRRDRGVGVCPNPLAARTRRRRPRRDVALTFPMALDRHRLDPPTGATPRDTPRAAGRQRAHTARLFTAISRGRHHAPPRRLVPTDNRVGTVDDPRRCATDTQTFTHFRAENAE
jgi:hypothetical protein